MMDVSDYARDAIRVVDAIECDVVSTIYCMDVFRGASNARMKAKEHHRIAQFGAGSSLPREVVERLFNRLLGERILIENTKINKLGFPSTYVVCNKAWKGMATLKLTMAVRSDKQNAAAKTGSTKSMSKSKSKAIEAGTSAALPLSTNVSSPVQALKDRSDRSKAKTRVVASEDESDDAYTDDTGDESDGFEPVREALPTVRASRATTIQSGVGPPITLETQLDKLNDTHKFCVEDFVENAKAECKKIMNKFKYRTWPFSETILRAMAINWTESEAEMREIPGINKDMLSKHGHKFQEMIMQAYSVYQEMVHTNSHGVDYTAPHAQNVIVIESDDEDYGSMPSESEHDGQDEDDDDDDEAAGDQVSRHFQQDAEAFNSRYGLSQTQGFDYPMKPAAKASGKKGKARKNRSSGSRGGRNYNVRFSKASTGGASNDAGDSGPSRARSNKFGKAGSKPSKRSNDQSRGGGAAGGTGIFMMPV